MSMVWMIVAVLVLSLSSVTPGYKAGGSCEDRCGGGQAVLCAYFCGSAVYQHRVADQSDKKDEKVGKGSGTNISTP